MPCSPVGQSGEPISQALMVASKTHDLTNASNRNFKCNVALSCDVLGYLRHLRGVPAIVGCCGLKS